MKRARKTQAVIHAVVVRELKGEAALQSIYPLIKQLNPKMSRTVFQRRLREMCAQDYRCAAAYLGDTIAGVAGFWTGTRFYCGKYMDIDNVVVDDTHRGEGIGALLMSWLEAKARREGCRIIVLDTYTHFTKAHKFYFREGYTILGYHFRKDV